MFGPLDEYLVTSMMELKSSTMTLSFVATVFMGKSIIITWDNLNKGILQIWGAEDLGDEEVDFLDGIVWEFIKTHTERERLG